MRSIIIGIFLTLGLSSLYAQFDGGRGEGSQQRTTLQSDLTGVPGGIRPLYAGGRGDGADRLTVSGDLDGSLMAAGGVYGGGRGDGHDRALFTASLSGTDLASVFGGGAGDGHHRAQISQSLGGFSLAGLYGGGAGDGYDALRVNQTLSGAMTDAIFGGGDGDGYDNVALTSLLGAPMTMLFGGGDGDGADRLTHYATLKDQDLSLLFRGGDGDGADHTQYFGAIPFPLTLLTFDAFPESDYVLVKWTTEDEIGTDFFTVEKTRTGREFSEVDRVTAAGFSEPGEVLHYQLRDEAPFSGTSFYRLQTTDFDGAISYSHLVEVEFSSATDWNFALFPNPNTGRHFSLLPEGIEPGDLLDVEVTDAVGRTLYRTRTTTAPDEALRFDLAERLPAGSYLIRVGHPQRGYRAKILIVGGR